ncbi:MAG: hypothetical protein H6Q54_2070 [Deltaproteobacteria bacterium]|jgi:hypothetical protein|nr:hypothetical protein [Deltaproteobacteria bacterium]
MKKMGCVVSIVLTLVFVQLAQAQMGKGATPRFYSEFKPVVGGWSEYQMTTKGGSPTKMKIAVVAKEGDAYWYETSMEGGRQGGNIVKMLVSGDPGDTKNVKRMIIKEGDKPAMEMPVGMMQQSSKGQGQSGKVIDKGTETIKVPAGTFKTQHSQYQDAEGVVDTWMYKDVSPYGMIKSVSKDMEMVLIGYGTGAKTQITETPQKFEMPQMPEGRPRRK